MKADDAAASACVSHRVVDFNVVDHMFHTVDSQSDMLGDLFVIPAFDAPAKDGGAFVEVTCDPTISQLRVRRQARLRSGTNRLISRVGWCLARLCSG